MKQNWQQLTAIQFGFIGGLPAIMVGYLLANKYGFYSTIFGIVSSCIFLFFLGLLSAWLATSKNLTTIEYAEKFFGKKGTIICSLSMGISLFGWFIFNLHLTCSSIIYLLEDLFIKCNKVSILINLSFGTIITIFVFKGIQSISRLANWSMPVFFTIIGYAFYVLVSSNHSNFIIDDKLFNYTSIGTIIAANIGLIIDMPTYYRFAASKKDAFIAVCLTFFIFIPLFLAIGAVLGPLTTKINLIEIIRSSNSLMRILCLVLVILSGLTINVGNLYSCNIALRPLISFLPSSKTTILLGLIGTFFSFFDLIIHFERLLDGITIFLSSMTAVMLTNFLFDRLTMQEYNILNKYTNSISMLIGVLGGFLSFLNIIPIFTGYSFLDSSIIAIISLIIFRLGFLFYQPDVKSLT